MYHPVSVYELQLTSSLSGSQVPLVTAVSIFELVGHGIRQNSAKMNYASDIIAFMHATVSL
jgi:hypothetical protein